MQNSPISDPLTGDLAETLQHDLVPAGPELAGSDCAACGCFVRMGPRRGSASFSSSKNGSLWRSGHSLSESQEVPGWVPWTVAGAAGRGQSDHERWPLLLFARRAHTRRSRAISELETQPRVVRRFDNSLCLPRDKYLIPPRHKLSPLLRVLRVSSCKTCVGVWICNEHRVQDENKLRGTAK